MKYRIRNTESDKVLTNNSSKLGESHKFSGNYFLGENGVIYDTSYKPMNHLKAEFEMVEGVYEGDCLLLYTEGNEGSYYPYVYEVIVSEGTPSFVEIYNEEDGFYIGEPEPLVNLFGEYEVIECR